MLFALITGSHRQKLPPGEKNIFAGKEVDWKVYTASKDPTKPTIVSTAHLPPKSQRLDLIFGEEKFKPLNPFQNAELAAILEAHGYGPKSLNPSAKHSIQPSIPTLPPGLEEMSEEQLRRLAAEEDVNLKGVAKGDRDGVLNAIRQGL